MACKIHNNDCKHRFDRFDSCHDLLPLEGLPGERTHEAWRNTVHPIRFVGRQCLYQRIVQKLYLDQIL